MNRSRFALLIASLFAVACLAHTALADDADAWTKHDSNKPAGRRSVGGAGEMVHFTANKDNEKIAGIRIHGSRYPAGDAPKEKFVIYFLNADGSEIINTQMAPYSLFEPGKESPGDEKWVDVKFAHPIELPKDFWVLLDFHATQNKGIYVSFDTSSGGKFSRMGLPWLEARDVDFGGDWMIQLVPAK